MTPPNPEQVLAKFAARLLAHSLLDESDCRALLSLPRRHYPVAPHQSLAALGSAEDHCWLVTSGLVARIGATEDGSRQILGVHLPGELANLSAMCLAARPALEAVARSTVLAIPLSALRKLVALRPGLGEALTRECLLAAEILVEWLMNVGRRDARSRTAYFFCELALRYAEAEGALLDRFLLPMSQEQLADALALTPVHVNRTLKVLRQEGIVTFLRGVVGIHDWARLASVAGFNPAYLRLRPASALSRRAPASAAEPRAP